MAQSVDERACKRYNYFDPLTAGTLNTASCRLESARPDAVVIYAAIPTTAVVEFSTVESVERLPLGPLWRRVRDLAGVARAEYLAHFDGLVEGVAIFVRKAQRLNQPFPLRALRAAWPGFHPPQGFRYLDAGAIDGMCSLIVELRRAA